MNRTRSMMYAAVFIIGFVGISLWSFLLVTRVPTIESNREPSEFKLSAEEVSVTAEDGTALSAWLIPSPESTEKAILLLHGYPAEKGDLLPIARAFYPDFSIMLLDLRHFGKSDGSYTTLGVKERGDVLKALDFLKVRGYERIGIFGFSLGGAVALMVAAEDTRVTAVGAYASYADLRQLGYETYSNLWLLKYPLVELMNFWSRIWFGDGALSVSPVNAAVQITVPTLLIHSRGDEQIPFSHAEVLIDALSGNEYLETYLLDRGRHGELPTDFNTRLKAFFTRSL